MIEEGKEMKEGRKGAIEGRTCTKEERKKGSRRKESRKEGRKEKRKEGRKAPY